MFWKDMSLGTRLLFWSGLSWIVVLILHGTGLLTLGARQSENARSSSCQSQLKQLGLAFMEYKQDYGELPSANGNKARFGWADALQIYLPAVPVPPSPHILQCPSKSKIREENPEKKGYTDYWMNARLSGRTYAMTDDASHLVMVGEGNDGSDATNARYAISALPSKWLSDSSGQSPLTRHLGAANYLFADGHVKALKPTDISANWSRTLRFSNSKANR